MRKNIDHNKKALPMWNGWSKSRHGKPEYDLENNTYFGFIDTVSSTEEIIDIFKENF